MFDNQWPDPMGPSILNHVFNKEGPMTLRETILQADDIDEAVIEVPEWDDVKITLRSLTGKERVQLYEGVTGKQKVFMYADILIATARDPERGIPYSTPPTGRRSPGSQGTSLTV